jgi:hypothetical protein
MAFDPKAAFVANAYNYLSLLVTTHLAGKKHFQGGDKGSTNSSWGQEQDRPQQLGVNAGQIIQLRWDLSSDGCVGWDGWYIDDVRVYSCTAAPSVQFISTASVLNEGDANIAGTQPNTCLSYVEKLITVKINKAPSKPVTVTLNAPSGTATQGTTSDYTLTPNSFTLQAGSLSKDILSEFIMTVRWKIPKQLR